MNHARTLGLSACRDGLASRLRDTWFRRCLRLDGRANGKLLALIAGKYDAFLTVDKNFPAQQKMPVLVFGVIVLRAPSNQLAELMPLAPQILATLTDLKPGQVIQIERQT